jgi:hypothetical protein
LPNWRKFAQSGHPAERPSWLLFQQRPTNQNGFPYMSLGSVRTQGPVFLFKFLSIYFSQVNTMKMHLSTAL